MTQHCEIEVLYYENTGKAALDLDWAGPGFGRTQMQFQAEETNTAPVSVPDQSVLDLSVTELADGSAGENTDVLSASGGLVFIDPDVDDTFTVDIVAGGEGYLGTLAAGPEVLSLGDGESRAVGLNYQVEDAALDYLAEGETLVQSYDVTVTDGAGASVTETVSVTLTGAADPVLPPPSPETVIFEGTQSFGKSSQMILETAEDTPLNLNAGSISFSFTANDLTKSQVLVYRDATFFEEIDHGFGAAISKGNLLLGIEDGVERDVIKFKELVEGETYDINITWDGETVLLYVNDVLEGGALSEMDWSQNGADLIVGGFVDDPVTLTGTSYRFDGTMSDLTITDLSEPVFEL